MDSDMTGQMFCNIIFHAAYTTNDISRKPVKRRNTAGGLMRSRISVPLYFVQKI